MASGDAMIAELFTPSSFSALIVIEFIGRRAAAAIRVRPLLRLHHDGFERALNRNLQKFHQRGNGFHAGGVHFWRGCGLRRARSPLWRRVGASSILAADRFARGNQRLRFIGARIRPTGAADAAGVGGHGAVVEAASGPNTRQ